MNGMKQAAKKINLPFKPEAKQIFLTMQPAVSIITSVGFQG